MKCSTECKREANSRAVEVGFAGKVHMTVSQQCMLRGGITREHEAFEELEEPQGGGTKGESCRY